MTNEVADISSYQADTLAFMQTLGKYAKSVIVKITEGSEAGDAYVNPKAASQVANGFKVFKSVGAYHFFKANSQKFGDSDPVNEAKWFIKNLKAVGLNESTVCALDVEAAGLMQNTTHDVNLFLKYMAGQGYKRLVVYGSASWFNSGRIQRSELYQQTPIWVASYGSSMPGVDNASAWQYTDKGHGLNVDFSYDFDGTLLGDQTNNNTGAATQPGSGSTSTVASDALHVHADQVYQYFTAKGLSDAAICGILGNFQHESGINPTQWQIGMPHTWSMKSATGYGIAQFTPAGKIKAYADKLGKSVTDITVQLDYIWGQLSTNGFFGSGPSFIQFAHATDPREAAKEFLQNYEMHTPISDALRDRESNATYWWGIYNRGNQGTYGTGPTDNRKLDTVNALKTTEGYTLKATGSFTFTTSCNVRNTPEMSADGVATYTMGGVVHYNQKIKNDGHFWLSYISASGVRRYVPYANLTTGTYFGNDTNQTDPIQTKNTGTQPSEHTGTTLDTVMAEKTPENYLVEVTGSFTFNMSCGVRDTPLMSSTSVATYTVGMTVNYDQKLKRDGHFWLSYVSATGTRRYIPYANIESATYFGTDTNSQDPVDPDAGGGLATTPEKYTVSVVGTFTFNTNCRVRQTPYMSDAGLATYTVGMTVNYDQKMKNDGHFWLSYLSTSGARRYVPYANISKGTYFGTDTNQQDPIQSAK